MKNKDIVALALALVILIGLGGWLAYADAKQQPPPPVIEVVAGTVIAVDLNPADVDAPGSQLEELFDSYPVKLDMVALRKTGRVLPDTLPGKLTYDLPPVPASVPLGRHLIQLRFATPPPVRYSGYLIFAINMTNVEPPRNARKVRGDVE